MFFHCQVQSLLDSKQTISDCIFFAFSRNLGLFPGSFVFYGLKHKNSFLRYRITDLISVSDSLKSDYDEEIRDQKNEEKNKSVLSKIKSILNIRESESLLQEKLKNKVRDRIAHGDTRMAIRIISEFTSQDSRYEKMYRAIVILEAEYERLRRDEMLNVVSLEETNIRHNKINHRLLTLLNEV